MRARSLPRDDSTCGWFADLDPAEGHRLRADEAADAVVIGAGFTGLAIARRLAELQPSWRVLVLDAQSAGFGASGRSSGFVVDLASFVSHLAPDDAGRFIALSRQGIANLRRQVLRHRLDCGWDETGWLHGAATDAGRESLEHLESWLESRGEPYESLGQRQLQNLTGSAYYRAAVRLPGSVLVQPAVLARGLARALPGTVELYENTPVYRLHHDGLWRLRTRGGEVSAPQVFLAVNALLPTFGVLRDRLFPIWTFGSMTRPLRQQELDACGGRRPWGLLAQDPLGSTVRRTADGRLLVRNSVLFSRSTSSSPAWRVAAARHHRQALIDRFPTLGEVPFDHTWGGVMGMTRNGRHFFGCLGDRLWATGGFNAAGIALGTVAGQLLAERAIGHRSPALEAMEALPGPAWIPPEPIFGAGARWRLRRMRAEAGVWV
ncbi:MAG: FAD-binding oxidoreductase [Acidobacteriota bacterium]